MAVLRSIHPTPPGSLVRERDGTRGQPDSRAAGKGSQVGVCVLETQYLIFFSFFLFGCGMQQLDVGSQFPDQALDPSHSDESVES